jgi:hypothetical protein
VSRYSDVLTYWGPRIEFSRKSFIEERSLPWYALTSTAGREVVPPGIEMERLAGPPLRKNTAEMRIITAIMMIAGVFGFMNRELCLGSY